MWSRLKQFLGIIPDFPDFDEVIRALHGDVVKRNFLFHILIIMFECVMVISISMRPGGPFAKPRRVTYFALYLVLILAAAGVTWLETWIDRKKQADYRLYFRAEAVFLGFFSLWGVAVTLNDQLGGNGLTVYNYVVLILAIMSMMKPWQAALLFLADFILLNGLLPCFPDLAGLDNSFNNLMNSLFPTLAAAAVAASLYNSKLQAKRNEIIIRRQYRQIEAANQMLSREALSDALTNLGNRNRFKKTIQAFEFDKQGCGTLGCIYIDVNGLHEINNHLGHQAGDQMLKTISDIFQEYFDSQDIFRIGGDEFVILCKNVGRGDLEHRTEQVRRRTEEAGFFLSTGLEWRESALDIEDVIQKAERAMQENKRGFYSSKGGERQKRELNQYMERLISEKKDADRFLSILAPVFEGVFFVNLETDTVRQIFIPSYFQEMLEECGDKYSRALLLYADRMVEPQYASLFELCCDYSRLEAMLEGDEIPDFTYRKKDGSRLRLRILKFYHYDSAGKETLWIFSDIEINYIEL